MMNEQVVGNEELPFGHWKSSLATAAGGAAAAMMSTSHVAMVTDQPGIISPPRQVTCQGR